MCPRADVQRRLIVSASVIGGVRGKKQRRCRLSSKRCALIDGRRSLDAGSRGLTSRLAQTARTKHPAGGSLLAD